MFEQAWKSVQTHFCEKRGDAMNSRNTDSRSARHMRDRLLDAFVLLLKAHPFTQVSVNDVCQTAEVSRGSFYRYFGDKYDLLRHFMARMTAEIEQRAAGCCYREKARCIFECLERYRPQLKHLLLGRVDYEVHLMVYGMYASEILAGLAAREAQGERFPSPAPVLADFCAAGISHVQMRWVRGDYAYSRDEMADIVAQLACGMQMVPREAL